MINFYEQGRGRSTGLGYRYYEDNFHRQVFVRIDKVPNQDFVELGDGLQGDDGGKTCYLAFALRPTIYMNKPPSNRLNIFFDQIYDSSPYGECFCKF